MSFRDVRLSRASSTPVTDICASAMMLLLAVGNEKVGLRYVLQSCNINTSFRAKISKVNHTQYPNLLLGYNNFRYSK